MALTARQLNRALLARQLLLRREPLGVPDAVRRIVGLQAQEPASPYLALWNRVADFDPSELDAAFADATLVKAQLMRITLHAVHAEDYPAFHNAMWYPLRASRLGDPRFTSSGLTKDDADALVPRLLEFTAQPRSAAEIEEFLAGQVDGAPTRGVWWALRTFAPLWHVLAGKPWSFGTKPVYRAAPPYEAEPEELMPVLVRRYLAAFGPASEADFTEFAILPRSRTRAAFAALSDELVRHAGPDGKELLDVPGAPLPDDDVPAPPRLLGMWDLVLLGHVDRSRVIPPEYRTLVMRSNGDVLPPLLVDGHVAGVWRPVDGGIEATAFHPLPEAAWDGLAEEARGLTALLAGRDPAVYRRYARWWTTLPAAEVRVLPGD
ncbi:winged helix DNA-binding domain-containing protein [Geodermatophilus sp. URMC 64]